MTTAIIRRLRSGGAVFELGDMMPHWFPDWRRAVAEAESRGMDHVLLGPEPLPAPVVVLATA
jgi:hypothetical protein